MKFEESLLSRSLNTDMRSTLAMSNARRNPDAVMSFDEFLMHANAFQPHGLQPELVSALTNNYAPVYTVGEVAIQLENPMESIDSGDLDFDASLDMQG